MPNTSGSGVSKAHLRKTKASRHLPASLCPPFPLSAWGLTAITVGWNGRPGWSFPVTCKFLQEVRGGFFEFWCVSHCSSRRTDEGGSREPGGKNGLAQMGPHGGREGLAAVVGARDRGARQCGPRSHLTTMSPAEPPQPRGPITLPSGQLWIKQETGTSSLHCSHQWSVEPVAGPPCLL